MGCRSSTMRPEESAMSTAPSSSRRKMFTFFTRGSAAKARSFSAATSGSFSSGRTSAQGRMSG